MKINYAKNKQGKVTFKDLPVVAKAFTGKVLEIVWNWATTIIKRVKVSLSRFHKGVN